MVDTLLFMIWLLKMKVTNVLSIVTVSSGKLVENFYAEHLL